ncbi:hypothetical protein [Tepidimonas charontis]|uniref:Uncharacterized protein n=1 Tax=Tepidimonas charontis TaxID=2267262 RepID=A0A554X8F1_9BURK|nr:hypothetical protein [Tepidimonas charontis]TSE32108.1 hypothetical protein Tchar_02195 [Tepidimonas charontis]
MLPHPRALVLLLALLGGLLLLGAPAGHGHLAPAAWLGALLPLLWLAGTAARAARRLPLVAGRALAAAAALLRAATAAAGAAAAAAGAAALAGLHAAHRRAATPRPAARTRGRALAHEALAPRVLPLPLRAAA